MTHEIELFRRQLREGIDARLKMMLDVDLADDIMSEVVDAAALLMHIKMTRTLDTRVLNLQGEVKMLHERLGEQRGKAIAYRKEATWWQQRYNALRKRTQ